MTEINNHYTELKSITKNTMLVDTLFPGKYRLSPYQACQHACKYCDGRAEKYYVTGDFEKDIVIRRNIPQLLTEELAKAREIGTVAINSGVSDPYQPVEKEERIMRSTAQVLAKHNLAASIMTKSSLIKRDIDLWEQVHQKAGVTIMVSLTFADDELRKIFEPGASSVKERLSIIKEFKERGIYVGVLAMPVIPYISDTKENIMKLVKKLKEVGVDFIIPGALTLRLGKQKDIFMKVIEDKFPQLVARFKELYKEDRQSGIPIYSYRQKLYSRIDEVVDKFAIPNLVPHYVYQDNFPLYDEAYILLTHMQELYSKQGVDTSALEQGLKRYTKWLEEEKSSFNRRRNLDYRNLEQKLLFSIHSGELTTIIKNEKMSQFIKQVVIKRKTFDYPELKLRKQSQLGADFNE